MLVTICVICMSKLGHYRAVYGILHICNVDFAEIVLFKSYGIICLPLLCFTVPDELLMNRSDSDGFFLR